MGKGGTITLKADGRKVAGGRLERTIPIQFSIFEGLDVGMDSGSPVDFTYELPFKFTGRIDKVTIALKQQPLKCPRAAGRERLLRRPIPAGAPLDHVPRPPAKEK
jgi:hypothetical protein